MRVKPSIALLMTALVSYGQSDVEPPKYEVATIKPNTDNDFRFAFRIDPRGPLSATGITLKRLMMTAYNVQGFRIVGGPYWVVSRRWDVQARPDRVVQASQIRPMLRGLLEDRFQLRSHSEERQMRVYELSVDRKGSKVERAKESETKADVRVGAGLIQLTRATAATFASQLSYALGRPVIDKTGLSGEFDFALEWTPEPGEDGGPTTAGLPPGASDQPASANGPSIFTAIAAQLGLRLKSARGPAEVMVIDNVRMPAAN